MEFIYKEPVPGFDDGLVVLQSYHEDFLERGKQLLQLAANLKQNGMNEDYANQCMEAYCHYSHATHLHHQDEEQSLFPLLLGSSALVDGMIERLMMDHEEIEESWSKLAKQLSNPGTITNFDYFLHQTIEFEKILREHLTREDEDFSPQVKKILTSEQIRQAGEKMAELRHLTV